GVSSDIARKQMQAAIVYNMLSAADCRILQGAHVISSLIKDKDKDGEYDAGTDHQVLHFGPEEFLNEPTIETEDGGETEINLQRGNRNGFTGRFRGFYPLVKSGNRLSCTGTESAVQNLKQAVGSGIGDLAGSIVGSLTTAGGIVVGGLAAAAFCGATAGVGCVALGLAAGGVGGVLIGSGAAAVTHAVATGILVPSDLGREPGYDMEGAAGKVLFEVKREFNMGVEGHRSPLFGMSLKTGNDGNKPYFLMGRRYSYLLPTGLTPNHNSQRYTEIYPMEDEDKEEGDFDHLSKPAKSALYAYRVRMEGVPVILETSAPEIGSVEGKISMRSFLDNSHFKICKGASGYIQSNAQRINNSGEAAKTTFFKEDMVYPKVKITENATSCIDTSSDSDMSEAEEISKTLYKAEGGSTSEANCGDTIPLGQNAEPINIICKGGMTEVGSLSIPGYGEISNPVYVQGSPSSALYTESGCVNGPFNVTNLVTGINYLTTSQTILKRLFLNRYQQDSTVKIKAKVPAGKAMPVFVDKDYINLGIADGNHYGAVRNPAAKEATVKVRESTETGFESKKFNSLADSATAMMLNITYDVQDDNLELKAWPEGSTGSSQTVSTDIQISSSSARWITVGKVYYMMDAPSPDDPYVPEIQTARVEGDSVLCS
ncbi:MAG: hypothetical protein ABEJ83_05390, partial [Candidatus Nanohaloarchaea archaeon]